MREKFERSFACYLREKFEKELCLIFEGKVLKGALHVIRVKSLKRSFARYLREKFEKELPLLVE